MHSYEVALEDWFVAAENQVGGDDGLGRGFYYQMAGFENGRLQTAARAVGVMQAAYEEARQYSLDRVVFGQPIHEYQLTQAKLGRMVVLIQAGRQFSYEVAKLMAAGQGQLEASMVKAYVCKAAEWVTREAMQIHGGMGYAEEYKVSRYFVDARVLSIFEGADETLCLKVIARRMRRRRQVAARRLRRRADPGRRGAVAEGERVVDPVEAVDRCDQHRGASPRRRPGGTCGRPGRRPRRWSRPSTTCRPGPSTAGSGRTAPT